MQKIDAPKHKNKKFVSAILAISAWEVPQMLWKQLPDNMDWMDKLKYFLVNGETEVTHKDLSDALCVLLGMYLDEYSNCLALEDAILEEFGEDKLNDLMDKSITDSAIYHYSKLLEAPSERQRKLLAVEYLEKLQTEG